MNWNEFQKWCAALCAWREARGEGRDGLRAVLHVIANRARMQQRSWAEIVYARLQFSSMTYPQDPQLTAIPRFPDPIFEQCYEIADAIAQGQDEDLTGGATHYYADSIAAPSWAATLTRTAQVGHHIFFR